MRWEVPTSSKSATNLLKVSIGGKEEDSIPNFREDPIFEHRG